MSSCSAQASRRCFRFDRAERSAERPTLRLAAFVIRKSRTWMRMLGSIGSESCEPADMRLEKWRKVFYSSDDARLRLSARMTVLKPKESSPCSSTIRRMRREVTWTSEVWHVVPITKEK